MNHLFDLKANLAFLGLIAFNTVTPDHIYKCVSFLIFAGYNIHRWYKFHQETKTKK